MCKKKYETLLFIAEQSVGNKNGHGRRPANQYRNKLQRGGYFVAHLRCVHTILDIKHIRIIRDVMRNNRKKTP